MKKISVIIVGGGTAGWMTASAMSKLLPKERFQISLIESEQIGTIGVGEATIPSIRYFNRLLGIDEIDFMKATSATFKLGIQFENWGNIGDNYIHPFGDYRYSLGGLPVGIHHFLQYANQAGFKGKLEDLSVPALMCRNNKFDLPSSDRSSLLSTYNYAYHLDATAYAAFLRKLAESNGVVRYEGLIDQVHADGESITGLSLKGKLISADYYIDASGFRSLLLGGALDVPFDDWSNYLICDSAVAVPSESSAYPPYTRAIAQSSGWQWRIPLQHRSGNGLVYSSAFMDRGNAESFLLANLHSTPLKDPIHIKFKAGKRIKAWKGNCIAVGLSGGFLEPLESTSIFLIQEAILNLIDFFKNENMCHTSVDTYNRLMDVEYERVKDFLILHYFLTNRDDSEFWRYCKNMKIPDSLAYKIDLFATSGLIESYKYGLFQVPSWLSVFMGQGLFPSQVDARVGYFDTKFIETQLKLLADNAKDLVGKMPSQRQFIIRHLNIGGMSGTAQ